MFLYVTNFTTDILHIDIKYSYIILRNIFNNFEFLFITDNFDLGYDIQQYFALHQNLFLEDLARTNSRHTLNGLMRVVSKVRNFFLSEMMDVTHTHQSFSSHGSQKLFYENTFSWIFIKKLFSS